MADARHRSLTDAGHAVCQRRYPRRFPQRAKEAVGARGRGARRAVRAVGARVAESANKQLTEQIATALREHPDGEVFLSLFRDPRSVVTAAELLAVDRRLPSALSDPRHARRRRRPSRRRDRVRQAQDRQLPLGPQQATARRVLHPGPQHPPLAPLGPRPLRRRPRPRPRAPRRATHPRSRPVPRRMALLARPHPPTTRQRVDDRGPFEPSPRSRVDQFLRPQAPLIQGPQSSRSGSSGSRCSLIRGSRLGLPRPGTGLACTSCRRAR